MIETNGRTPTTNQQRSERCHKLAHDLKNCLAVIGSGLDVLQLDPAQRNGNEFQEIHEMMEKQRRAATLLVDELQKAALERED